MEFKIVENENIEVVLFVNEKQVAKATCYLKNTPEVENKNVGTIGNFEAENEEYGIKLLEKCEEIFKEKNIKMIIAPMNGNTWRKYRTLKQSSQEPPFLLENVNPLEHNVWLEKAGFKEIYTYTSTKGSLNDAYDADSLRMLKGKLEEENIVLRKFSKENYYNDLKKIYNISVVSFSKNPLYTPVSEEEFIKQYEPYINMVDEDFILIAEKEGQEVGFLFCIPNFNELKLTGKLSTLIVKTIAVLPEYQRLSLGSLMLNRVSKVAKTKNFENWIFAFMYTENSSQKMAKRNKTQVIREYALYGKEI